MAEDQHLGDERSPLIEIECVEITVDVQIVRKDIPKLKIGTEQLFRLLTTFINMYLNGHSVGQQWKEALTENGNK